MAIIEHKGNLLVQVKQGIIVHGCNTLGAMGAGFALSVKQMYPAVFDTYRKHFEKQGLHLGEVVWARALEDAQNRPILAFANAITQDKFATYKGEVVASLEAIRQAFETIRPAAEKSGFAVHFPEIGCGLGGLTWPAVSEAIDAALGPTVERHLWRL